MATHNVEDGTGGLDASIRFAEEQARAENVGDGFANTIGVLSGFSTRYTSIADTIALGLVMGVQFCGGPRIPFRGGRIDATEPNSPGVPEPDQTLDSHIASFARQGFTQEEMIGLVACGHTFGGVQHDPFPNIVHEMNDTNNTQSVAHFDTTELHFDNNIATEYISGTTQNPLAVGFNDTTNSDKRIFGSDGNVTMRSFADSPELFSSRCSELFARMLDTVPKGVQLSEVITPLPVKPGRIEFKLDGDVLQFTGNVRVFLDLAEKSNRIALLLWSDHLGATHNSTLLPSLSSSINYPQGTATSYRFGGEDASGLSLDAAAGIVNMQFMLDGKLQTQQDAGAGVDFAVQDAVSAKTAKVKSVYIETETRDDSSHIGVTETDFFSPDPNAAVNSAYTIWTLNIDGVKYTMGKLCPS
ncbi:peroxidase [Favolaschia claudopus]|uniref:Peroxidase n=1 Tax=Favolaschia claudopus TaxID=2862362 RepID=A0AAV9ZP19_9AGAR